MLAVLCSAPATDKGSRSGKSLQCRYRSVLHNGQRFTRTLQPIRDSSILAQSHNIRSVHSSLNRFFALLILETRSRGPQRSDVVGPQTPGAPTTTPAAQGDVRGTGIASGPNTQSTHLSAGQSEVTQFSDAPDGDPGEHCDHEDVHLEQI